MVGFRFSRRFMSGIFIGIFFTFFQKFYLNFYKYFNIDFAGGESFKIESKFKDLKNVDLKEKIKIEEELKFLIEKDQNLNFIKKIKESSEYLEKDENNRYIVYKCLCQKIFSIFYGLSFYFQELGYLFVGTK